MKHQFAFQAIANGTVAVDTFFVLSGFLATFLFLKELENRNYKLNGKMVFMYYFHRFWRLLPMLSSVIVFHAAILPRLSTGPLNTKQEYKGLDESENCKRYWWRNILFISNLFDDNINSVRKKFYITVIYKRI